MKKGGFKLLILVKSIDGGTGTYVLNLLTLRKFFKTRLEIKILSLEYPSYRKLTSYQKSHFIFLHQCEFYPTTYNFSFKNILSFVHDFFLIKRHVNTYKPEVILSVDLHCNLLSLLLITIFKMRLKKIITTHIDLKQTIEDKSSTIVRTLLTWLIRISYHNERNHVCVSQQLAGKLSSDFHLKHKPLFIYNGISMRRRKRFPTFSTEKKVIISIARLTEQKDHKTLINAYSTVSKLIEKSELWIISDGPERRKLVSLVKQLNLSRKVIFLGWVKSIYPYLKKSSLFILSSKREGFSFSLLEAMSYGLPIISTNTPYGPSEILDEGKYGILVRVGDENALSRAALQLVSNEEKNRRYSQLAQERSKFFSIDKMLASYKPLLESLI